MRSIAMLLILSGLVAACGGQQSMPEASGGQPVVLSGGQQGTSGTGSTGNQGGSDSIAANPPASTTVKVFKYDGSVQCGSRGESPAEMSKDLAAVGISVLSMSCGSNGMAYPAVCGAGTGSINIFEISVSQLEQAKSLSFSPLSALPHAVESACR